MVKVKLFGSFLPKEGTELVVKLITFVIKVTQFVSRVTQFVARVTQFET